LIRVFSTIFRWSIGQYLVSLYTILVIKITAFIASQHHTRQRICVTFAAASIMATDRTNTQLLPDTYVSEQIAVHVSV